MSRPPAARAAEYLRCAIEALAVALPEHGAPRRRRDWRARALKTIGADHWLVLDARCPPEAATARELARLERRLGQLRPQLPASALLGVGEAVTAVGCPRAATEQAIGSGVG